MTYLAIIAVNVLVFLIFLADEVQKQLKDAGATYMYTSQELLDKAKEAAATHGKIKVMDRMIQICQSLLGMIIEDVYDILVKKI